MTLEEDWERVKKAFIEAKKNDNPIFAANHMFGYCRYPKELRKADNRGIDFALRRLLDSDEYQDRIRLYGAPTGHFGRNPFIDSKGYKWALVRIKIQG